MQDSNEQRIISHYNEIEAFLTDRGHNLSVDNIENRVSCDLDIQRDRVKKIITAHKAS